jgi:hypothetical protein
MSDKLAPAPSHCDPYGFATTYWQVVLQCTLSALKFPDILKTAIKVCIDILENTLSKKDSPFIVYKVATTTSYEVYF